MAIANDTVPDGRLRSLGIFLDVVFALIFFRIVEFLPSFQDGHWVQLPHGLLGLLARQSGESHASDNSAS